MVYLPLVTSEDIEKRIYLKAGTKNSNYQVNDEREAHQNHLEAFEAQTVRKYLPQLVRYVQTYSNIEI